jgi:ABC-type transporter Mla subunit MlaD
MTRLELITLIGDLIERLTVLAGSMMPDDPRRPELDDLLERLDAQQLQLAKTQFDENTASFKQATAALKEINIQLKATLDDVNALVETIANLKRFVSAVNDIIGAALPLVV